MSRHLGIFCFVAGTILFGGCRTEYLAEPDVFRQALQTEKRLQQAGQDPTQVAVRVVPMDPQGGLLLPRYIRLSDLRVEKQPDATLRLSTRNRAEWRRGGGVLLGLGLLSIVGGGLGIAAGLQTHCGSGDDCLGRDIISWSLGMTAIVAGIHETVLGGIVFGPGARKVEVPGRVPGVVYVPERPQDAD